MVKVQNLKTLKSFLCITGNSVTTEKLIYTLYSVFDIYIIYLNIYFYVLYCFDILKYVKCLTDLDHAKQ